MSALCSDIINNSHPLRFSCFFFPLRCQTQISSTWRHVMKPFYLFLFAELPPQDKPQPIRASSCVGFKWCMDGWMRSMQVLQSDFHFLNGITDKTSCILVKSIQLFSIKIFIFLNPVKFKNLSILRYLYYP